MSLYSVGAMAHSQAACLAAATNNELVGELEVRLSTGGTGGSEFAFATFSCYGSRLDVSLVDQDGNEDTESLSVTTTAKCEEFARQMTQKAGSTITEGLIVASCYGSRLDRLLLNAAGVIKELSSQSVTTTAKCEARAKEINETN